MFQPLYLVSWLSCLIILLNLSKADVGTATFYNPPYLPTACYGNDASQFPSNNLFASAGEGIWDNGASCGREYLVRCLSAVEPNACAASQTIRVKIIDRAASSVSHPSRPGKTMALSAIAFRMIVSNPSTSEINIEYQQV